MSYNIIIFASLFFTYTLLKNQTYVWFVYYNVINGRERVVKVFLCLFFQSSAEISSDIPVASYERFPWISFVVSAHPLRPEERLFRVG